MNSTAVARILALRQLHDAMASWIPTIHEAYWDGRTFCGRLVRNMHPTRYI